MRKFLVALMLATALAGCTTLRPTAPAQPIDTQAAAEQVVYTFELAFQATPEIVNALVKNGTVTPHTYNTQILPAYNQGLASLNVLISALKACETSAQDPNQSGVYVAALAQFLTDKSTVDNLLTTFGKGGEN